MRNAIDSLPLRMWDSFKKIQDIMPYTLTLLTRHSIREQMEGQGLAGYHLPLTQEGRKLASAWGEYLQAHLAYPSWQVISSPVGRCMETAQLMLPNHLQNTFVLPNELLVEPGSFVTDIAQAGPHFKVLGALQFINGLLKQEVVGLKHPHHGVHDILLLLYQMQMAPIGHGRFHLAVSHDTIIAALLAVLAGKQHISWEDWPEMMEGVFLWFEGEPFYKSSLHWVWRGQYQVASMSDLLHGYLAIAPNFLAI